MQSPSDQDKILNHFPYIDALRGIAFLGVLWGHVEQQSPQPMAHLIALVGMYGVQLFFLLSAITLSRSITTRGRQENRPLSNYFLRRFARIAPMFWFGIVLYCGMYGLGPHFETRLGSPERLTWWDVVTTATFTNGWTPHSISSVVPGGWSIVVEMTFYLCLPWLFHHLVGIKSALAVTFSALVAGGILTAIIGRYLHHTLPASQDLLVNVFLHFWFPTQCPVFLLGIALYYCLQNTKIRDTLTANALYPSLLVASSASVLLALTQVPEVQWLSMNFCYGIGFALLILGLSARSFPLLVNGVTRAFGNISYSCYLTHFACLSAATALFPFERVRILTHNHTPGVRFMLVFGTTLFFTWVFASVTYRLIEEPGIALGRWLIQRGERRAEVGRSSNYQHQT